ncbi:protein ORF77 [Lake sturgeon herpesvirus]|nr:protein ORF77 [Lake sturgeon herpesvirus]
MTFILWFMGVLAAALAENYLNIPDHNPCPTCLTPGNNTNAFVLTTKLDENFDGYRLELDLRTIPQIHGIGHMIGPMFNYKDKNIHIFRKFISTTNPEKKIKTNKQYYLTPDQPHKLKCPLMDSCITQISSISTKDCTSFTYFLGDTGSKHSIWCNQMTLDTGLFKNKQNNNNMALICPQGFNIPEQLQCKATIKATVEKPNRPAMLAAAPGTACNVQIQKHYNCSKEIDYYIDTADSLFVECLKDTCVLNTKTVERYNQNTDWTNAISSGLSIDDKNTRSTMMLPQQAVKALARSIAYNDPIAHALAHVAITTWSLNPTYGIQKKTCLSDVCVTGSGSDLYQLMLQALYVRVFKANQIQSIKHQHKYETTLDFIENLINLHRVNNTCPQIISSDGKAVGDTPLYMYVACWALDMLNSTKESHIGNSKIDIIAVLKSKIKHNHVDHGKLMDMSDNYFYTTFMAWCINTALQTTHRVYFIQLHQIFYSICQFENTAVYNNPQYISLCHILGGQLKRVLNNKYDEGDIQLSIGANPTTIKQGFRTQTPFFSYSFNLNLDQKDDLQNGWKNAVEQQNHTCLVGNNKHACIYTHGIYGHCPDLVSVLYIYASDYNGILLEFTQTPIEGSVKIGNKKFVYIPIIYNQPYNLTKLCYDRNSTIDLKQYNKVTKQNLFQKSNETMKCDAYFIHYLNTMFYPTNTSDCPVEFPQPVTYLQNGTWITLIHYISSVMCEQLDLYTSDKYVPQTKTFISSSIITQEPTYNSFIHTSDILIQLDSGITMRTRRPVLITNNVMTMVVKLSIPQICKLSLPEGMMNCSMFLCGQAAGCLKEVDMICLGKQQLLNMTKNTIQELVDVWDTFRETVENLQDSVNIDYSLSEEDEDISDVHSRSKYKRSLNDIDGFSRMSMESLRSGSLARTPSLTSLTSMRSRLSSSASEITFTKPPRDFIKKTGSVFTRLKSIGRFASNVASFFGTINSIVLDMVVNRLETRINLIEDQVMRFGEHYITTTATFYEGLQRVANEVDVVHNRMTTLVNALMNDMTELDKINLQRNAELNQKMYYIEATNRLSDIHAVITAELRKSIIQIEKSHDNLIRCAVSLTQGKLSPDCINVPTLKKLLTELKVPDNCTLAINPSSVLDYYAISFSGVTTVKNNQVYLALDIPLFCDGDNSYGGVQMEYVNVPRKANATEWYVTKHDVAVNYIKADDFIAPLDVTQCLNPGSVMLCPPSAVQESNCITDIIRTGNGTCEMQRVNKLQRCYFLGSGYRYCTDTQPPSFSRNDTITTAHLLTGVIVSNGLRAIHGVKGGAPPNMESLTPPPFIFVHTEAALAALSGNAAQTVKEKIDKVLENIPGSLEELKQYLNKSNSEINELIDSASFIKALNPLNRVMEVFHPKNWVDWMSLIGGTILSFVAGFVVIAIVVIVVVKYGPASMVNTYKAIKAKMPTRDYYPTASAIAHKGGEYKPLMHQVY